MLRLLAFEARGDIDRSWGGELPSCWNGIGFVKHASGNE